MDTMPFGKFKGEYIGDLPDWYLNWLHELRDLREPLYSAIEDEWNDRFGWGRKTDHPPKDKPSEWPNCPDIVTATEIVAAGVKSLARRHHPDIGGSPEKMVLVNNCGDWFREQLKRLT